MADQVKKTQDEKLMENMNQGVGTQQPNTLVRQASAVSPVGNPQAKPAASGQFTNVRNFLGANVGAGQRLAETTASGVQRGVEQAKGQVTQFGQKVGEAVGKEKQALTEADKVRSGIQSIVKPQTATTNQQDNAPVQNPFALVEDDTQFNQARRLVEGQTNVADIIGQKTQLGSQAQQALTMAGQQVGQLGTESGRFNLLRRAVGGPQYTRGMQGLDNLLLSTEGAGTLAQAQQQSAAQVGQQGNILGSQTKQFATELSDIDTQARAISEQLKNELSTGLTSINVNELDKQFAEANQAVTEEAKILGQVMAGSANLNDPKVQEAIKNANLDLNKRLYGLDVQDFLQGAQAVDRDQLINQQQAARINALNRLMAGEQAKLIQAGGKTADDFRARINTEDLAKAAAEKEKQIREQLKNQTITGEGIHSVDRGFGIKSEAKSRVAQNAEQAIFGNQGSNPESQSNTVGLSDNPYSWVGVLPGVVDNVFGGGADSSRARQLAQMEYERNLQDLMRQIQFNDTLASRNRRT